MESPWANCLCRGFREGKDKDAGASVFCYHVLLSSVLLASVESNSEGVRHTVINNNKALVHFEFMKDFSELHVGASCLTCPARFEYQ